MSSADSALNTLGVDLDRADVSAQHDQGLEVQTRFGRAIYARAGANSPAGSLGTITRSSATGSASSIVTLVSTGNFHSAPGVLAINQVSISANSYGWWYTEGNNSVVVRTIASCAPNLPLYTTATAGVVDDATVSAARIEGLRLVANATVASASAYPAVFHNMQRARQDIA